MKSPTRDHIKKYNTKFVLSRILPSLPHNLAQGQTYSSGGSGSSTGSQNAGPSEGWLVQRFVNSPESG